MVVKQNQWNYIMTYECRHEIRKRKSYKYKEYKNAITLSIETSKMQRFWSE